MTELQGDTALATAHAAAVAPGRRELNRTRLRQTVHATTWQLVKERGYDEVTVEDIAAGAGISVATFYRHFAGKDEVVTRRWLSPERFGHLVLSIGDEMGMADATASLFSRYAAAVDTYDVSLLTRLKIIHLDGGLRLAMARGREDDVDTLAHLFARLVGCSPDHPAVRLAAAVTITGRAAAMSYWAGHLADTEALSISLAECARALAPTLDHCEAVARASLSRTS